jgi:hypothetical protein
MIASLQGNASLLNFIQNEVQNGKDGKIDLSGWLREADVEAENYRIAKKLAVAPTPLVIIKASNKGVGEAYVVQRLSDALAKL